MKTIYRLNLLIYSLTLLLYASVYLSIFGMLSQVVLGFIQVLSSIVLLLYWNLYSYKIKTYLLIYWSITAVNLAFVFYEPWRNINHTVSNFALYFIPMFIATYFTGITYTIQKKTI